MRFLLVRIYRIVRGSELWAMWKSDQALEHPCNRQILIIFNRSRSRKRELFIVGLRMQKPLSTVNSVDNLGAFLLWNLERLMNDLPSLPLTDLVQLSSYGRWFLSGKGILFFPLLDGNQKGACPYFSKITNYGWLWGSICTQSNMNFPFSMYIASLGSNSAAFTRDHNNLNLYHSATEGERSSISCSTQIVTNFGVHLTGVL